MEMQFVMLYIVLYSVSYILCLNLHLCIVTTQNIFIILIRLPLLYYMHINVRCANENENTFSIFLCLVSYQGKIFEEGKKKLPTRLY